MVGMFLNNIVCLLSKVSEIINVYNILSAMLFSFSGNWINALKSILKSVYGYFSYDINSYIASKLESQSTNGKVGDLMSTKSPVLTEEQQSMCATEEKNDSSETESDESEERTAEKIKEVTEKINSQTPVDVVPMVNNSTNPPKPHNNKLISSFTVENILMGKQRSSSSSTSVQSPTSSNSTTSLVSPTGSAGSISSSIVGVNWVSHPPVKYTKFTMVSPTAMSDETQKRKKSSHEAASSLKSDEAFLVSEEGNSQNLKPLSNSVSYTHQGSSDFKSINANTLQKIYPISSLSGSPALPVSTPLTNSTRLCTLPVVTTLTTPSSNQDGKAVLSKTFPPSQQYVLLVPSSSIPVTSGLQSVVHSSPGASQTGNQSSLSVGNTLTGTSIKTVSFQSSSPATTTSSQKTDSVSRFERTGSANHVSSESPNSFRLIAPKQNSSSSTTSQSSSSTKKIQRRIIQKPQKLRFHMTTVVTKQKRMPVTSSMTVESPSAVIADHKTATTSNTSPSKQNNISLEKELPIESEITCSPNVYSSGTSKARENEMSDVESTKMEVEENVPQKGMHNLPVQNGASPLRNKATSEDLYNSSRTRKHAANSSPVDPEPILTRHRGRATRSYTRRKRELTFHLYEDPETAFKAKKACKD